MGSMGAYAHVIRLGTVAVALALSLAGGAGTADAKSATDARAGAYPHDEASRNIPARGRFKCPDIKLVRYRGDLIRYSSSLRINEAFRDRLRKFEKIVRDTAVEVYGRAPRRIKHLGSYYCRRIRTWPTFISEHGLGNAVDVAGFDFGPAPRKLRKTLPRGVRWGFRVRMDKHWNAKRGVGKIHARFLRLLAERVVARHDVFRVMLGPAEPGHNDHFHFDMAPWRIVNIFESDTPDATDATADP